jgi:hypothetical protein
MFVCTENVKESYISSAVQDHVSQTHRDMSLTGSVKFTDRKTITNEHTWIPGISTFNITMNYSIRPQIFITL